MTKPPSKLTARQTKAVRGGVDSDTQHGAVMPPVYLTSNFGFAGFNEPRPHDYTSTSNPTQQIVAQKIISRTGHRQDEWTDGLLVGSLSSGWRPCGRLRA